VADVKALGFECACIGCGHGVADEEDCVHFLVNATGTRVLGQRAGCRKRVLRANEFLCEGGCWVLAPPRSFATDAGFRFAHRGGDAGKRWGACAGSG
jgi:hypothetical protein